MRKIILTILAMVLCLTTCNMWNSDPDIAIKHKKAVKDLSFQGGIEVYKKSYDYYKNEMQDEEVAFLWLALFKKYTYVLDGNLKDRRADCLSAYWYFFQKVGSNVLLESIPDIMNRVKKLYELRQITIYKDYGKVMHGGFDSVQRGDVIIFHYPNAKINYHIVVVWSKDSESKRLQYVEMGGPVFKANLNSVAFNNGEIAMIFSPSFAYWMGDALYTENIDRK
jgi:hypothetical protein